VILHGTSTTRNALDATQTITSPWAQFRLRCSQFPHLKAIGRADGAVAVSLQQVVEEASC
jgi:hypothetical protein